MYMGVKDFHIYMLDLGTLPVEQSPKVNKILFKNS